VVCGTAASAQDGSTLVLTPSTADARAAVDVLRTADLLPPARVETAPIGAVRAASHVVLPVRAGDELTQAALRGDLAPFAALVAGRTSAPWFIVGLDVDPVLAGSVAQSLARAGASSVRAVGADLPVARIPYARSGATAMSAMVGDDIFLQGLYIVVGVSGSGSFGTANDAPGGFYRPGPYSNIGYGFDPDGIGQGAPSPTGDFFLPGTPLESFSVGYRLSPGGSTVVRTNYERGGVNQVANVSVENLSSGSELGARYVGDAGNGLQVTQTVSFSVDDEAMRVQIDFENVGTETLYDVRYLRNVDPDQDRDTEGDFSTINEVLSNFPGDNRAVVVAEGPVTGEPLYYVSEDPRARVSYGGFDNRDPYDPSVYDSPATGSNLADEAITIAVDVGSLEPSQTEQFVFLVGLSDAGAGVDVGLGQIRFESTQVAVDEGDGSVEITVVADDVPENDTDVTVTLVSGDPADVGGFTSQTLTFSSGPASPTRQTITLPITDDFLPEENESLVFELSLAPAEGEEEAGYELGTPFLTAVIISDNDGDPVTVTVPTGDGGLRVLSLPVNGVTAGDVAAAAGADGVLVFDAGAGAFVPAGPDTPLMAGQPVLVDVDPGADLTFTGSAPTGPTAFAQTTVEADGAARVLVPVGNPSGEPLSLSALTVEGGALADVALVFDPTSGAFVPVSLAALGCCDAASPYLYPYAVVVLQVTPDGDPAGVRVTVGEDAPGGSGESVTEAAFEPTDGESAVVLEVRPAGADGATRLAAEALVAEAPGDVLVLRLGVGGDGLDPFDGFDVVSPPGATLATPGPEGSDALYAALSWPAPGVGEALAMPLYLRVPEPGAYEMVLAGTPSEVDGRPVVVTLFDGTTSTELGAGEPFTFTVAEGDSVLAGRFSVELSVGAGVAAEVDPAAPSVSVYPNPAAGRATVALSAVTGDVRVSVFDALGREVAVLHDGPVAGSLEASVAPGRLVPGAYLVRVAGEGLTATRALTVVR
jgi:hypothetical protein